MSSAGSEDQNILKTRLRIPFEKLNAFVDWQAKFNCCIAGFPGFVSLEILSPTSSLETEWIFIQRFSNPLNVTAWRESKEWQALKGELTKFLVEGSDSLQEDILGASHMQGGVTEVFVTQVSPDKEEAFHQWIAKIHQAEAKFPGFRGAYVQAPSREKSHHWITLLQFDTPENLDRWLSSSERQQALQESLPLITSLESHRVISPYAGWFTSLSNAGNVPVWKQTMVILLVLFPLVMLELKFLPH